MSIWSSITSTLGAALSNTVSSLSYAINTTINGPSSEQVKGVKDQIAYGEDEQQKFFATHPNAQMADYYAYLAGKTVSGVVSPPSQAPPSMDIQKIGMFAILAIIVMKILK